MSLRLPYQYGSHCLFPVIFHMENFLYFKFRPVNKFLIDSLVNRTLYFARPSRLNDPFDCQVDLRKSAQHAITRMTGSKRDILKRIFQADGYFDAIQQRMANVGVCSFSLKLEEPLLWSHYADEHRGVCLLYQFNENFLMDRKNEIVGVSDITYGENPLSDWIMDSIPDQIEDTFYERFTTELLKRVLIIKGSGWAYEHEARIIREQEGTFSIPKGCLKQVCFGLKISSSDMNLVKQIVEGAGYQVSYCQMQKMASDFGIQAAEI